MKKLLISLVSFIAIYSCDAQILKDLGNKLKGDAEWRLRYKADQQVNKGIDSLLEMPKKIKNNKKSKKDNTEKAGASNQNKNDNTQKNGNQNPSGGMNASASGENDMGPKDGFITLALSASQVFTGGIITISGESIKYKNFKDVEITINGAGSKDVQTASLNEDGKYQLLLRTSDKAGEYTITATSSDKKAMQSAKIIVYELPAIGEWCNDNIEETNKAYDRLKKDAAMVEDNISPKDKAELEKKMAAVKEQVDAALTLFRDLNAAGKELAKQAKQGKKMPPNLSGNLSDLNNNLAGQAKQMKAFDKLAEHEPQDNTICEYLVMLNEACAAFQTFTNFWSRSVSTILVNIITDKAVPTAVGAANSATVNIPSPADFVLKEPAKIFATSKLDAQSLTTKMGKIGIGADIVQFASDVLLKVYCGVFTGDLKHDYTIDFRNSEGKTWWKYGVTMEASFTLRYPKKEIHPTVVKMKGSIEGNATAFTFFEDVAQEDGFNEGSKGKIEVIPLHTYQPLALPFAASQHDPMGFGAVARGAATPACFYIPVDAEYDIDANKIKIFINPAILDFTELVCNQFVFLLVGGDLLPYFRKMNFPIHKAALTLNAVIRDHNEFDVKKDAEGNLSFDGKGNRHIGDKSTVRETDLNFTISAKKN